MLRLIFIFSCMITIYAQPKLEHVASFGLDTPPGNIAVASSGRVFVSLHSFFNPKHRLIEILPNGDAKPFPDDAWSSPPKPYSAVGLHDVLGLNCDGQGRLWLLDGGDETHPHGKLVAWNTHDGHLERIIYIPPDVLPKRPFLNDLAIDTLNNAIYIADTSFGNDSAIIVVDLQTGLSRRVLHGYPQLVPEDIDMVIDDRKIMMGPHPARIGINPITIDYRREYIYFGPMSGKSLYRLSTRFLSSTNMTDDDLAGHITRYGDRPISDGVSIDNAGNVYITAITENAIGVTKPDGSYQTYIKNDALLSWPDSIASGPTGYMYVVVNQLHRSPPLNGGELAVKGQFSVYRFRPLAGTTVGR